MNKERLTRLLAHIDSLSEPIPSWGCSDCLMGMVRMIVTEADWAELCLHRSVHRSAHSPLSLQLWLDIRYGAASDLYHMNSETSGYKAHGEWYQPFFQMDLNEQKRILTGVLNHLAATDKVLWPWEEERFAARFESRSMRL